MTILFITSIVTGLIALLSLVALHFTSPEFKPGWRMVSEYALGKYKWLLTVFFFMWGLSSLLASFGLLQVVTGFWPYIAAALLAISGMGAVCGGLFDVTHKKHGMAFTMGVPPLPVAALVISYHLLDTGIILESDILIAAHATWISIVLMAVTMMLMFSGFKKAGIKWGKDAPPPVEVPKGVIALGGYANRLLVFCFIFWVMYCAFLVINR